MISEDSRRQLTEHPERHDRAPIARPMRALVVARSRMAEDEIARRHAEGVDQYVVLGAGLDTFAYRHTLSSLRVFEVDQPSTQQLKRRRLADAHIEPPRLLTYVPFDFLKQSLADALRSAGFDPARPAVFAWLGVAMYLDEHDVDATLRLVASLPARTSIVFDYALPPESRPWFWRIVYRSILQQLEESGEPWRSFFEPDPLRTKLLSMGFAEVEDIGSREINSRLLANRHDGLQAAGMGRIVVARK